jgi:hypothetical protein
MREHRQVAIVMGNGGPCLLHREAVSEYAREVLMKSGV